MDRYKRRAKARVETDTRQYTDYYMMSYKAPVTWDRAETTQITHNRHTDKIRVGKGCTRRATRDNTSPTHTTKVMRYTRIQIYKYENKKGTLGTFNSTAGAGEPESWLVSNFFKWPFPYPIIKNKGELF